MPKRRAIFGEEAESGGQHAEQAEASPWRAIAAARSAEDWYCGVDSLGVRWSMSSRASSFHPPGKASSPTPRGTISPGLVASCANASAARAMSSCTSGRFGGPAVFPSGKSVKAARGGLAEAVMVHALVKDEVTTPAASSARAISPTD